MNGSYNTGRMAQDVAARWERFKEFAEIAAVLSRYDEFLRTPEGIFMDMLLTAVVLGPNACSATRKQYDRALVNLAKLCNVPLSDIKTLAEIKLEFWECIVLATGH